MCLGTPCTPTSTDPAYYQKSISESEFVLVVLKTDAKAQQGKRTGIYERYITINGKRSWKSNSSAIWFDSTFNNWKIGSIETLGSSRCGISSPSLGHIYPYDVPSNQWKYYGGHEWKLSEKGNIIIQSFTGEMYNLILENTFM